ncbi:DUF6602 domain-containing protein [Heyndrickxia oleronia]|uniref:DUF6602 domain-containing protein n=1 Tax=Heyndrickxia oleronia TaxID=38875 RepID=UPI001C0EB7FF|nr:DUF6602 domain-containing protein [Heyndrickxia oleronia]MBU5214551.1 hypothetical protein [Heyndrickxia oleronia]
MSKYLYNNYLLTLSNKFLLALDDISADYNFDYGDEFEIAICSVLRKFLPLKYGVCRGHVVSSKGEKEGDDIIIYDQERFPTLKINKRDDFSRKENIPIEAVYAYIEAKHKLDSNTFDKSLNQVSDVKKLILTRNQTKLYQPDPYINPASEVTGLDHFPSYRNPVFTMILSRFSVSRNNEKSDSPKEIQEFLDHKRETLQRTYFEPELIVASHSNFLSAGYITDSLDHIPTYFALTDKNFGYQNLIRENLSYGIALAYLMGAIDYIRLGKMPWADLINDAKLTD